MFYLEEQVFLILLHNKPHLLNVNDTTHRGEGFVTFSVDPKLDITTGTQIFTQAKIYFDDNPSIST